MAEMKRAVVVENKKLNEKFHLLKLEMRVPEELKFTAGQFIALKVTGGQIRDYSIASSPGENKHFDLLIDVSGKGIGATYLQNLKPGEEIEFLAPLGNFIFKCDDPAEKLLFVATGSGIAPFRSIIEDVLKNKKEQRPVYLYWGMRHREDLFLMEEFERLTGDYPNFKYKICLSKPDEQWQGEKGHVTENVAEDFDDFSNFSAYLCGNKQMIEEVTEMLKSKGLSGERCYHEMF
jgi:NAD(P)H-flavin reductase